jgi:hypothetical protein
METFEQRLKNYLIKQGIPKGDWAVGPTDWENANYRGYRDPFFIRFRSEWESFSIVLETGKVIDEYYPSGPNCSNPPLERVLKLVMAQKFLNDNI